METKLKKDINKVQNAELKMARKVTNFDAKKVKKASKKLIKPQVRAYQRQVKETHLKAWAKSLADPFSCAGAICPVSFNPSPSISMTTARLTNTMLNFTVPANQTIQHVIFPGHGAPLGSAQPASITFPNGVGEGQFIGSDMDPVAYHAKGDYSAIANGGIQFRSCVGPVGFTANGVLYEPFCVTASLIAAGACNNGIAGLGTSYPIFWDVPLPYSSDPTSGSSHLRWQLVSCGLRVFNTTPMLSRGGNVTTVQFVNNAGVARANGANATSQAELEYNPSFRVHGDCSDGIELSWIPRTQDLAYWHNLRPNTTDEHAVNYAAKSFAGAGMAIFFNNPTGNVQNYSAQYVFNFMLSGNLVQALSSEAVNEQTLRAPIEQTVAHLQNTSSTARPAPDVSDAAKLGDTGQTMSEKLSQLGSKMYAAGQEGLFRVAAGVTSAVLSHHASVPGYDRLLVPRRH